MSGMCVVCERVWFACTSVCVHMSMRVGGGIHVRYAGCMYM